MPDHLFSPWRLDYVTSVTPAPGCVFCDEPFAPDSQSLVVFQGALCYVLLNRFPYNNGHVMVAPYRHVGALSSLTVDEVRELSQLEQRCERALIEAYQPQGINVGINLGKSAGAGILEHLHVHFVPRWDGDTNFMTVIGTTRVLPEGLVSSAARLRAIFRDLAKT